MKAIIQLEELAMFVFSILVFSMLPFAWGWFLLLLLAPDISMIGYLINNKVGAISYNFFHHRAVALLVLVIGYYLANNVVLLAGVILFAHIAMDRLMGYGLKYFRGFKYTHLSETEK